MTATLYTALLLLAQSDGAGRGDNPSEAGGALILVGAVILAILMVGAGVYFVMRSTTRRRGGAKQGPGREG
ncbi:MAG TPA: hypothetical protein VHF88_05090 [Thermoleophilaceae bacterium]|nr:hypothetical protein [Thermoleophilaceae bacterium]